MLTLFSVHYTEHSDLSQMRDNAFKVLLRKSC